MEIIHKAYWRLIEPRRKVLAIHCRDAVLAYRDLPATFSWKNVSCPDCLNLKAKVSKRKKSAHLDALAASKTEV